MGVRASARQAVKEVRGWTISAKAPVVRRSGDRRERRAKATVSSGRKRASGRAPAFVVRTEQHLVAAFQPTNVASELVRESEGRSPSDQSWLRGGDLNPRPLGYEPNELPDCSTPRQEPRDLSMPVPR